MTEPTVFQPWLQYGEVGQPVTAELLIAESPCRNCRQFAPRREYTAGLYTGVRLCHAAEMHNDFSCFISRAAQGVTGEVLTPEERYKLPAAPEPEAAPSVDPALHTAFESGLLQQRAASGTPAARLIGASRPPRA